MTAGTQMGRHLGVWSESELEWGGEEEKGKAGAKLKFWGDCRHDMFWLEKFTFFLAVADT